MRTSTLVLSASLALFAGATPARAGGLEPGSVLVFPVSITDSAPVAFTAIAVTNLDLSPITPQNGLGGSTNVHYQYVNAVAAPPTPDLAVCSVADRIELLTPADTRVAQANCDDPGSQGGYLVVSALDPNTFADPWSHNHLIGSELVIGFEGGLRFLNAIPFKSLQPKGSPTDLDLDGQLDFDGIEYEGTPDELIVACFLADVIPNLALLNLSGGLDFTANVRFDVFNDNEQALSATLAFRCWVRKPLVDISVVFDPNFLRNNTMDDFAEIDLDCSPANYGDAEAGWAIIRGVNHSSTVESCPDAALLGSLGQGEVLFGGAARLWESKARQLDGDFVKTGTDDPECGTAP